MLRRVAVSFLALALLAAAAPAQAQSAVPDRRQFGFGIGANASFDDTIGALPFEIYLPLRLSPALKIEPTFGLRTASGDADFTDLILGMGVFSVRRVSAPVDLYFGGRLKLNFISDDTVPPGVDDSGIDFYLTAAAGGEYFVVPSFSLGAEANLGFYSLDDLSGDASGIYTAGIFLIRVYL